MQPSLEKSSVFKRCHWPEVVAGRGATAVLDCTTAEWCLSQVLVASKQASGFSHTCPHVKLNPVFVNNSFLRQKNDNP